MTTSNTNVPREGVNPENAAFLPLTDFYRNNGYDYKLEKRVGDVAVFEQYSEGKLIAYEVFEVRKQKETDWGTVHYEAKEKVPSSEEWGNNAFTVSSLKRADFYVEQILKSIAERENNTND